MSSEAQRKEHAAYMRAYNKANSEHLNARRRERYAADPAKKAAADRRYRKKVAEEGGLTAEQKQQRAASIKAWQERNPEKMAAAKLRYYRSDKGRLQKQKEDAAFIASGRRAVAERKRAEKPISEPRKRARETYNTARRSGERSLDEFAAFVLREAAHLRQLRFQMLGTKWHIDHVVPVSKGGGSAPDNIQVVPALWNRRKSNVHTERFIGA